MTLAVVVVDPRSTGATIAERASERGYTVLRVWSAECPPHLRAHVSHSARDCYAATLEHTGGAAARGAVEETARKVRALPFDVVAVLCGSESGVLLSDALAAALGLRGNDPALGDVRRSKYHQQEAVRAAGLRAVRQALATSSSEARAFAATLPPPLRAIVKPVASAGSEDVALCRSLERVAEHAAAILAKRTNALGERNAGALVQEYLEGDEYIVDCVSRDGVHKCVAVYAYDKREGNGSPFCYYGQRPLGCDGGTAAEDARARALVAYTRGVLDALAIRNGATHSELIVGHDGAPCLVECNCRAQGGNGEWLQVAEAVGGGRATATTQVSALLDAFLEDEGPANAFAALPAEPPALRGYGMVAWLLAFDEGTLLGAPGLSALRGLRSYAEGSLLVRPGERVVRTVDANTVLGVVVLVHAEREVVEADYALVHQRAAAEGFLRLKQAEPRRVDEHRARACTGGVCGKAGGGAARVVGTAGG